MSVLVEIAQGVSTKHSDLPRTYAMCKQQKYVLSNLIVLQVLHLASIPVYSPGEAGIEGSHHMEPRYSFCFSLCI